MFYKIISCCFCSILILLSACKTSDPPARPNILWITIEDLTPMLGCYADPVARTPVIDQLASQGVRFTNAYASAAVCAPARSCLVTGVFATTLGTQNLRSETSIPDHIIPFPKYLRQAGYYCTNNYKEDYNFEISGIWGNNEEMILRTRDSGLATEAYMYQVSEGSTPYQALQDQKIFPLQEILNLLDRLYFEDPDQNEILSYLEHHHSLIRYWTMVSLQYRDNLDEAFLQPLSEMAKGEESLASITAAETLCKFGRMEYISVLTQGLSSDNPYLLLMSARAFELIENKPDSAMEEGKQAWLRLREATEGKWKGYDLYAYWSLSQVYG